MAEIGSLLDLLLFYSLERLLFNRMVGQMGKEPGMVKRAMALWLALEEIGYYDLTRMIHSKDDQTVEAIFDEVLACFDCILPNAVEPLESDDTPVFVNLFDEPLNRRFFYYNSEFMYKRFMHIMDSVCNKIFGETAAIEVDELGMRPVVRPHGEGSSAQGAALGAGIFSAGSSIWFDQTSGQGSETPMPQQSGLNPDASLFFPGQTSEDTRTMFLTFSSGLPISRQEIIKFFTSNWGPVVQDVVIEQPRPGFHPLHGRIILTSSFVIPRILNGQAKAKFMVDGKHLWARIYVPRQRVHRAAQVWRAETRKRREWH